jgi:sugar phosphate isomerase/epimerase
MNQATSISETPSEFDPRFVVNFAALPPDWQLDRAVAEVARGGLRRLGVTRHGLDAYGLEAGLDLLRGSGLETSYLLHRSLFSLERPELWAQETRSAQETIDSAVALDTPIVYATTGSGGGLEWEEAAARFVDALAPVAQHARAAGVQLLLETTNPQFADLDILHSLADTAAVARAAGVGICFDIHASWTASGLRETVAAALPDIGLVQVSEYVPGTRNLRRSVPGDGVIPFDRIIGWLLDGGFQGPFDLELWGIDAEDPIAEFRRASAWVGRLLDRRA